MKSQVAKPGTGKCCPASYVDNHSYGFRIKLIRPNSVFIGYCSHKSDALKVRPLKVRLPEARILEVHPLEVHPLEVRILEVRSFEVRVN